MTRLGRRRFLYVAGGVGAASATGAIGLWVFTTGAPVTPDPEPATAPDRDSPEFLHALLGDVEAAARIGRVYIDEHGTSLVSSVEANFDGPADARRDFARGTIVSVDGWILPEQVAAACVTAALVTA